MRPPFQPLRDRFAALSIAGVWTLYVLLVALRTSVIAFPHKLALIERHALVALAGVLMTAALHLALRRLPARPFGTRLLAGLVLPAGPALILAALNYDVMFVFDPAELWSAAYRASVDLRTIAAQTILEDYFIFAGWAMLATAFDTATREVEASRQAALAALKAREAQLRALRYQLDPHFLFNALNTLSALVMRGDAERAEKAIAALSEFLRVTLAMEPSAEVTLEQEARLQALHLAIEEIRFGPRLRVDAVLDEAVKPALVPSLLLQPVVENVVRHALARVAGPVRLELRAHEDAGRLHLLVQDDAPGSSGEAGVGIGLKNIEARLALLYGAAARLEHGPREERGYRVRITLPLRTAPA